jgi:hypothetical protein
VFAPAPSASRPRRRRASLVVAAAACLVLAACGGGSGDGDAAPVLTGPQTVTGIPGLILWDLSPAGTKVYAAGSALDVPVASDSAAVSTFGDAVAAWLDTVLTERNLGTTTTFGASGLDAAAFATAFGITAPGTPPATQVVAASYLIELGYLGDPAWATVRVESTVQDLSDPAATPVKRLDVFVMTASPTTGAPELLAYEAAP